MGLHLLMHEPPLAQGMQLSSIGEFKKKKKKKPAVAGTIFENFGWELRCVTAGQRAAG